MKKEFLEEFVSAKWKTPEEMRAFVERVKEITAEDVTVLLDILTSKRIVVGSPEQGNRTRIFLELAEKVSDSGLFDHCLRALKAEDKHLRGALVALIPKVANAQQRPRICELLKSPDGNLRRIACQIMQKINDPNLLRPVGEMFRDRNFVGRNEALDVAGAIPGHYSVELFRTVLASGKPPEKVKALKYLANPAFLHENSRTILGAVRPALHDVDETVLAEAIATYAKVCSEEEYFDSVGGYLHAENLRLVRASIEGLRHFHSERTIAALDRKLYTGPNAIRMAVLDSIEHIGTSSIFKVLLTALEHKNNMVRERAGEVMTRLTRDRKIKLSDSVFWLLRSQDTSVKRMAVTMVASLPEKKSELWGEVLALVRNEDWWVRQRLVDMLVEMAGDELAPLVVPYLADPSDVIRRFSLEILLRLKSPATFEPVLNAALHDGDWWVREKAIEALVAIDSARAVPVIVKIGVSEPALRLVVIEAVKRLGAKPAAPQIASFLASDSPDVRAAALHCLDSFGVISDPKYAEIVLPLLKDQDINVRQLAKNIAKKWHLAGGANEAVKEESLPMIDRLLLGVKKAEGDDLILLPDNTPYIKRHGKTIPLLKNKISHNQMQSILMPILTPRQKENLQELQDIDFSYEVKSEGLRFRANVFISRTGLSAVFRIIKSELWKLEDLGLPPVVNTFGDYKNGLVLVGGPTGSGKSTTLSTIIAHINRTSRRHVISIEDPIEAVHSSEMSLINQREVGVHTPSFNHALRMTLREDPDVILVGELRDLSTIQFAVTAAETGHLVFGTVHTVSADASVDRLINAYPPEAQEQVRSMLADSLQAVLCQYLIRHKENDTRVLASEVMINNGAISNLIRKGKTFQIPSVIMVSREQQMQMMDASLMELFRQGKISAEEAYLKARNKVDFEEMVGSPK